MWLRTWIWSFGDSAASCARKLDAALQEREIGVIPRSADDSADIGLVLFEEIDDSVIAFVKSAACNGNQRLLAIHTAGTACPSTAVWSLLGAGATDVWSDCGDWSTTAQLILDCVSRWKNVNQLMASSVVRDNLVGNSPAWQQFLHQAIESARFSEASVLLLGESGTGKELVARMMHTLDGRPDKSELIILDCTTVVPELSGSEFFGHERGAFTGATVARDGAFALANGGTLFLDEVGELPPALQAQLLRVIQERKYKPVGGNHWRSTAFRLICATHRDLAEDVRTGRFRADLYYRIASCVLRIPALRDRPDDVLPLSEHFFRQCLGDVGKIELQEPVRHMLLQRSYPGNVRELRQLVARIAARHVGLGPVTAGEVPEGERPLPGEDLKTWDADLEVVIRRAMCLGVGLKEIGKEASEAAIRVAMAEEDGNLQRAARRLGVTDRALQMRRANQRQ